LTNSGGSCPAQRLERAGYSRVQNAAVMPIFLHDGTADKAGIFDALSAMERNMQSSAGQDLAAVMLSGHGTMIDNRFYPVPAQHVGVLTVGTGLDLDRSLLLTWVERGALAQHGGEAFGVIEVTKPAVALRLPTPRISASAVRRIQSGIACSDDGAINRLSVIAQASRRTARESLQSHGMRSRSRRCQN